MAKVKCGVKFLSSLLFKSDEICLFLDLIFAEPNSSVCSIVDLRTGHWFDPWLILSDSHCNKIHSSLTAVDCFNSRYMGKQPVTWKEYRAEYWFKEPQESMDRCTGHHDITEILLKMALNIIQSINF